MSYGSRLANGARRASFRMPSEVSQSKWDSIWEEEPSPATCPKESRPVAECPKKTTKQKE